MNDDSSKRCNNAFGAFLHKLGVAKIFKSSNPFQKLEKSFKFHPQFTRRYKVKTVWKTY